MSSPLDRFIPNPDIRERHTVIVRAPAQRVQDVARAFDMQSVPVVRTLVRARQRFSAPARPAGPLAGWWPT